MAFFVLNSRNILPRRLGSISMKEAIKNNKTFWRTHGKDDMQKNGNG